MYIKEYDPNQFIELKEYWLQLENGKDMTAFQHYGWFENINNLYFKEHIKKLFRFWKYNSSEKKYNKIYSKSSTYKNVTLSNVGEVLGKSITDSISTVLMIGGFVVLFSAIISILNSSGLLNYFVLL